MKILIGDLNHVDFDAPIPMTQNQINDLEGFLKKLFYEVEIRYNPRPRSERLGDRLFQVPWSEKETFLLFKVEDSDTVSRILGRTWMSIIMRRGQRLPHFLMWIHEQGINLTEISEEIVKKYFQEHEQKKEAKKQARRQTSIIEQKIQSMTECVVGSNTFGDECLKGYHTGCFTCPFSKGLITTQADIEDFNHTKRILKS